MFDDDDGDGVDRPAWYFQNQCSSIMLSHNALKMERLNQAFKPRGVGGWGGGGGGGGNKEGGKRKEKREKKMKKKKKKGGGGVRRMLYIILMTIYSLVSTYHFIIWQWVRMWLKFESLSLLHTHPPSSSSSLQILPFTVQQKLDFCRLSCSQDLVWFQTALWVLWIIPHLDYIIQLASNSDSLLTTFNKKESVLRCRWHKNIFKANKNTGIHTCTYMYVNQHD